MRPQRKFWIKCTLLSLLPALAAAVIVYALCRLWTAEAAELEEHAKGLAEQVRITLSILAGATVFSWSMTLLLKRSEHKREQASYKMQDKKAAAASGDVIKAAGFGYVNNERERQTYSSYLEKVTAGSSSAVYAVFKAVSGIVTLVAVFAGGILLVMLSTIV